MVFMGTNIYSNELELIQGHLLSDFMTLLREHQDVPSLPGGETRVPSASELRSLCSTGLEFLRTDSSSASSEREWS